MIGKRKCFVISVIGVIVTASIWLKGHQISCPNRYMTLPRDSRLINGHPAISHDDRRQSMVNEFSGNQTKQRLPNPVILSSQGRSGSTFLGSIVKLDPNVFYVFEPLMFLRYNYTEFLYLNGEKRRFENYLIQAENIIRNILICNITGLPIEFFTTWGNFSNVQGKAYVEWMRYFKDKEHLNFMRYHQTSNFRTLVKKLEKECKKATTVVLKIIRSRFYHFEALLRFLPNLKVILLVRDPRPVIMSQSRYWDQNGDNPPSFHRISTVCKETNHAVTTQAEMTSYYPGRVRLLMYEHLVQNLYNETKFLYHYLQLNYTDKTVKGLLEMTTVDYGDAYVPFRKKSKDLIHSWRKSMSYDVIRRIDDYCVELYYQVGYCQVTNETMLRNVSFPLFGDHCKANISTTIDLDILGKYNLSYFRWK